MKRGPGCSCSRQSGISFRRGPEETAGAESGSFAVTFFFETEDTHETEDTETEDTHSNAVLPGWYETEDTHSNAVLPGWYGLSRSRW